MAYIPKIRKSAAGVGCIWLLGLYFEPSTLRYFVSYSADGVERCRSRLSNSCILGDWHYGVKLVNVNSNCAFAFVFGDALVEDALCGLEPADLKDTTFDVAMDDFMLPGACVGAGPKTQEQSAELSFALAVKSQANAKFADGEISEALKLYQQALDSIRNSQIPPQNWLGMSRSRSKPTVPSVFFRRKLGKMLKQLQPLHC